MSSLEYWKSEFKKITNTDAVTNTDKVLGKQLNNNQDTGGWIEKSDNTIYWDKNVTSQETTKENEIYLGKAVVVFKGSEDEKMGIYTVDKHNDKGKEVCLLGDGAVLADVFMYDSKGEISNFKGYTMSSDPSKFGVVAEGRYMVNRLGKNEKKGPYHSEWIIENRKAHIPARNNYNPAHEERKPGYLKGVFIHRSNNDGWAGTYVKEGKLRGVSEGCLLINPMG